MDSSPSTSGGLPQRRASRLLQPRKGLTVLKPGFSPSIIPVASGNVIKLLRLTPRPAILPTTVTVTSLNEDVSSGIGLVNDHYDYINTAKLEPLDTESPPEFQNASDDDDEMESSTDMEPSWEIKRPSYQNALITSSLAGTSGAEESLKRRKIRNRAAAQKSRERKANQARATEQMALLLDGTVKRLLTERDELQEHVMKLREEFCKHEEAKCLLPKLY